MALPQGFNGGYSIRYIPIGHPQNPHLTACWEFEHRLVLESKLERLLKTSEVTHHIDGNKLNNTAENLCITDKHHHGKIHQPLKGETRTCLTCQKLFYAPLSFIKQNRSHYCSKQCASKSPAFIASMRKNLKPPSPNLEVTKYIVDQKDSGRTWKSISIELGITMWSVRSRYTWYMKHVNRKPLYISASSHLIKRVRVKCGYCGNPLEVTPSKLARSKSGEVFCNHHCSGKKHNRHGILHKQKGGFNAI